MALTKHDESDDFVTVERPDGSAPSAPAEIDLAAAAVVVEQAAESPLIKNIVEAVKTGGDAAGAAVTAAVASAPSAPPSPLNAANLEQHTRATGGDDDKTEGSGKKEIPSSQVGAGVLFGLTGLVLGGPLLALIAGTGAAVVADPNNETKVGEAARKSGDFVIENGEKVGAKAKEVDEEYGILDKIKDAFTKGWIKVKEFDEEHHVTEKTKEVASDVGAKTREFEEKHHWGEKILGGVKNGLDFLMDKFKNTTGESCAGSDQTCGGNSTVNSTVKA